MLGTSEYKHTAEEYRADRIEADYISKPQPLCFAFIDPLPSDIGNNIDDVAGWYRENLAMQDIIVEALNRSISSEKDEKSEFFVDEMRNEANKVIASSSH